MDVATRNEEKVDIGGAEVDIETEKVDIQKQKVDIESVLSEKGKEFSVKICGAIRKATTDFAVSG